jgi:hypothetical protein
VDETLQMLTSFLGGNYIHKAKMRSCVGKAQHIASLVPLVRPFLQELYAALHSTATAAHARFGSEIVWTKQVRSALTWLAHLLQESEGKLERTFELHTFRGQGLAVEICLDASPWGLGGFLTENGVITSFFAAPLSLAESKILRFTIAESAAQQTVEALAVLAALRAWKHRWLHQRVFIRVKSDSMSALILTFKLKTSGIGSGIIAREIALDLAQSEYQPNVVQHVPGVDNIIADELSRKYQPGHVFTLPTALAGVTELQLPIRDQSYFRSTLPPAVPRRKSSY